MNEKLIYCSTNQQNTDVVDVTVIENGKPIHGQIQAKNLFGWLQANANLGKSVGAGAGVGQQPERKTA